MTDIQQIAAGVLIHQSAFIQSNTVVVQGRVGVMVVDPGITAVEMGGLASELDKLGQPVVAGFSTHPHWDHLLWHPELGPAPRYGTARCGADIQDVLAKPDWKDRVAKMLPPDIASDIPMDLLGQITALPGGTDMIPWDGPEIRIIEHQAHAFGHAALFIKERGVLVAGDMLSDVLIPLVNLSADDPTGDYLASLKLLEDLADDVKFFIPGHGSVGDADQFRVRIKLDRAYVQALNDGADGDDLRLGSTVLGEGVLLGGHKWQLQQLAAKRERKDDNIG